jgi:hypothetical protein
MGIRWEDRMKIRYADCPHGGTTMCHGCINAACDFHWTKKMKINERPCSACAVGGCLIDNDGDVVCFYELMKEKGMKEEYLKKDEVYEGLRKIGKECPDTKKLLKKGFPEAFKQGQEYCCSTFRSAVRDESIVANGTWELGTGWSVIHCPFCGNRRIPPID